MKVSRHGRADTVARIREALRLRGPLLSVLAARVLDDDERAILQSASLRAWQLVLRAECCALPVAAALRGQPALAVSLRAELRAELDAAERIELQRVLAARHALRLLDRVATRLGVRATVIKGGVVASTDRPVDLGDVDVVVPPGSNHLLWQGLRAAGWRAAVGELGPLLDQADFVECANHFIPLTSPGTDFTLEIHTTVDYAGMNAGEGCVSALPGYDSLDKLSALDAAMLIIRHSVIKHAFRRGHLRDVALLARVLVELDPSERMDVHRQCSADLYAPELLEMHALAEGLLEGRTPEDSERQRCYVAQKYQLLQGGASLERTWLLGGFALERSAVRRHLVSTQMREGAGRPSANGYLLSIPLLRRIDANVPLITMTLRRLVHGGRIVIQMLAGPLIRRRARAYGRLD